MNDKNKHNDFKLLKNLQKNSGFKVPGDYFETIEDGVIAKLKAKTLNIKKLRNPFNVPDDYFNSVEDIVLSKLKAEVLQKNNKSKIPNNYFNEVEDTILTKLKSENKTKVIRLKQTITKIMIPVTIAASLLLLVLLNTNSKTITFDSITTADIENYLENDNENIDALSIASLYTESELDNENISTTITNSDVVDYLSEEDLEEIIYEN